MFLVIVVIQNTLKKPHLTNALMKQNSRTVSPFHYSSQSFVDIPIKQMIHRKTRWSEVVKGWKNNDQRGVIQCYLMTSDRQITRISPGFCHFLHFQGHFQAERVWLKISGFFPFSQMCGNPDSSTIIYLPDTNFPLLFSLSLFLYFHLHHPFFLCLTEGWLLLHLWL
jgi:hypothetical protein